jgi:hypothetical protein
VPHEANIRFGCSSHPSRNCGARAACHFVWRCIFTSCTNQYQRAVSMTVSATCPTRYYLCYWGHVALAVHALVAASAEAIRVNLINANPVMQFATAPCTEPTMQVHAPMREIQVHGIGARAVNSRGETKCGPPNA